MKWELPNVQAEFRKGRGTRVQIPNTYQIIEKAIDLQEKKKSTFASLTMLKSLTMWITANCGKSYRDGNTRPPYLSPEKPVFESRSNRTGHGTMDWFQIGKGGCQGCICHPASLTFT